MDYDFHSRVFARLILHRLKNDSWHCTHTIIDERITRLRCLSVDLLEVAVHDEVLAYDIFEKDFSRLPPHLQTALSGATRAEWYAREASYQLRPDPCA